VAQNERSGKCQETRSYEIIFSLKLSGYIKVGRKKNYEIRGKFPWSLYGLVFAGSQQHLELPASSEDLQ